MVVTERHTASPPFTETLLKELKEHKSALSEKERDLGDNHPDTLDAMKDLALTYYKLGQFRHAKVLDVTVLQKQRTILGDDPRDTLLTMSSLASTYYQLGQFEKAAEIQTSALDNRGNIWVKIIQTLCILWEIWQGYTGK